MACETAGAKACSNTATMASMEAKRLQVFERPNMGDILVQKSLADAPGRALLFPICQCHSCDRMGVQSTCVCKNATAVHFKFDNMPNSIWFHRPTLAQLNAPAPTLDRHLGIEYIEVGEDYLKATMPVDYRTHQPMGLLHGGASVALAETMGSAGAFLCVDSSAFNVVGLEINANHVRAVRSGLVTGIAKPIHMGRTTQLWEIRITDEADKLVCISRLTVAVLQKTPR
jgi:1,4-dihydroxy-2-naphthoyl-CoA hydrolase